MDNNKQATTLKSGYSLVTCSMNRTEFLIKSIQSWNEIEDINEIIVVDYSSDIPIEYSDLPKPKFGKKIILVRVNAEENWILSHAYNLGISFVQYDKLLKIDSDIILKKDFLLHHKLCENNKFYRGNHETARTKNEIHFNGQLLCYTSDFQNINGYNERLISYGFDDTDLYYRLEEFIKSKPSDFNYDTMEHQESGDAIRVQNQNIETSKKFCLADLFKGKIDQEILNEIIWIPFPTTGESLRLFFETQLNRIKCEKNPWKSTDGKTKWQVEHNSDNFYVCKRTV